MLLVGLDDGKPVRDPVLISVLLQKQMEQISVSQRELILFLGKCDASIFSFSLIRD